MGKEYWGSMIEGSNVSNHHEHL